MTSMNSDWYARMDKVRAKLQELAALEGYHPQSFKDLSLAIEELSCLVMERCNSTQGRNGGQIEQLIQAQAESCRLHDELALRSDRDRELMLQLIQNLAQGRNGGEGN